MVLTVSFLYFGILGENWLYVGALVRYLVLGDKIDGVNSPIELFSTFETFSLFFVLTFSYRLLVDFGEKTD